MADENKRIIELPLNLNPGAILRLPVYNPDTDDTEQIILAAILPQDVITPDAWQPDVSYSEGDIKSFDNKIWISQQDDNEGITPGTDTDFWIQSSVSASLDLWAAGVYLATTPIVFKLIGNSLYMFYLKSVTRPYNSTDFFAELEAGDWEMIAALDLQSVNTTTASIVIDFLHLDRLRFKGSNTIGAAKTWSFDNDEIAKEFSLLFELTTLDQQTFPASVIMSDGRWELDGSQIWTPMSVGKYKMVGTWDGANWWIEINGPFT